jgi:hypothetical protein
VADPFTDFRQQVARGDTIIFTAAITRPPGGPPVDLSGAQLVCTGRRALDEPASDYVFRLTLGTGITVTDATAGQVQVRIPPEATNTLADWPTLYVDLELTETGGRVSTPLRGRLALTPDVSRSA